MLYAFLTYLYFTLENFKGVIETGLVVYCVLIGTLIFFGILHFGLGLCDSNQAERDWKNVTGEEHLTYRNYLKHSNLRLALFPKTFVWLLVGILMLPSQNTLKWMVGAYVTAESVSYLQSNEAARELPDNVLKAANNFLEGFDINKVIHETTKEIVEDVSEIKAEAVSIKEDLMNDVKELTQEQKDLLIKKLTTSE